MTTLGIISDTHGLLRPQALDALRGSDVIVHAGDIGSPEIVPRLRELAPVIAVRGNVDAGQPWAEEFPACAVVEVAGLSFYLLHDLGMLDLKLSAAGFAGVIFGHSHKPEFYFREDHGQQELYFNPGSAGPRRFKLPISVGRITISEGQTQPQLITLG
ncbi:MAG TPA: metallophosphoesterase family protein [Clostridia bacterium]|nr:metallophosphoesterase family protein [Clostridia bacterium]